MKKYQVTLSILTMIFGLQAFSEGRQTHYNLVCSGKLADQRELSINFCVRSIESETGYFFCEGGTFATDLKVFLKHSNGQSELIETAGLRSDNFEMESVNSVEAIGYNESPDEALVIRVSEKSKELMVLNRGAKGDESKYVLEAVSDIKCELKSI